MSERKTTTNHETIRRWVEARRGRPATVRGTGTKDRPGVLRIDFAGEPGGERDDERLEPISWDAFFAKFDEEQLAFLYQEQTATGKPSRFFKLVHR
jgi:hypothetical protein